MLIKIAYSARNSARKPLFCSHSACMVPEMISGPSNLKLGYVEARKIRIGKITHILLTKKEHPTNIANIHP